MVGNNRLPSANSRQAAIRAKSKIYSKRNVQEIATSVSSTKNIHSRALLQKQMTGSLNRDPVDLSLSNLKLNSQVMSPDDYSRRPPAQFMSTQKIVGLSSG